MNFANIVARAFAPKDGTKVAAEIRAMDTDDEVEILVYDQIGYWGITSEEFRRQLQDIDATTIHLRIDCPGGDVFMARAMKTALEQHPARVIAHVDGLAASAASYLMLAADEIVAAKGAFVMIHNAWMLTMGDVRDHQSSADMLAKIDDAIRADYVIKTGEDDAVWRDRMNAETWLEAEEAVEIGLIDRVFEKEGGANNRFDVALFENAPAALLSAGEDEIARKYHARQMRKIEFLERTAP